MQRKEVDGWNETVNVRKPADTASRYELFRYWLVSNAELYEVTRDDDVMAALRGLERTLAQRIKDEETGGHRKRKRKNRKREKYVLIFKRKYVEQFDLQYTNNVTTGEGRGIDDVIRKLEENHLSVDEYLSWFFDAIMDRPDEVRTPRIKTTFAITFLDSFIVQSKQITKRRMREADEVTKERDLFHRLRVLVREGHKALVEDMKNYRNGGMTLLELQTKIEELEEEGD